VRRRASPPSAAEPVTVRIERIGAEGDGIANLPDGAPLYVPFTMPGEQVHARKLGARGELISLLESSADRAPPPCPHFGTCGGCVLQHWREDAYRAWKTELLRDALRRAGYTDPPIAPIVPSAPRQRRRMDFAARRTRDGIVLGLHARGGPVTDVATCEVLHPALSALLAPLRPLLAGSQALRREASVVANLLNDGVDLLLRSDAPLTLPDRNALIAFARAQRLLRVSWAQRDDVAEPVAILRPPVVTLSGIAVQPPPGAFLQASASGEAAIVTAVLAGVPEKLPSRTRIADLYAGTGTLSFALAHRARVTAFEGDAAVFAALRGAVNAAGLAGKVQPIQRDLARQPLVAAELAGLAAVVLDPPHVGAAAQVAQLATSRVPRVVYVSCNPAALARDARTLHAAGYRLLSATPIDQFLWSARLESVCVLDLSSNRT
jgi:23S rRNA (uracil1939-C5)-methyltransferase